MAPEERAVRCAAVNERTRRPTRTTPKSILFPLPAPLVGVGLFEPSEVDDPDGLGHGAIAARPLPLQPLLQSFQDLDLVEDQRELLLERARSHPAQVPDRLCCEVGEDGLCGAFGLGERNKPGYGPRRGRGPKSRAGDAQPRERCPRTTGARSPSMPQPHRSACRGWLNRPGFPGDPDS